MNEMRSKFASKTYQTLTLLLYLMSWVVISYLGIDGAGEFKILGSIVLPLSKPIIATVGLMTALGYWNDWQNGLYYLTARGGSEYYTIQIVLNNISEDIRAIAAASTSSAGAMAANVKMPSTTIRMAIAVVGILPILVIYPFFQRYFVKGITLGV